MVLPAGLTCSGDAFGKGWSSHQALFLVPCPDALLGRMPAGRGRKIAPRCVPILLMGAGSVPTPYNQTTSDQNRARRPQLPSHNNAAVEGKLQ